MTVVKTYCDHCGKELSDMDDYISMNVEIAYMEFQADLCAECHKELVEVAKVFCSGSGGTVNESMAC